MLAGSGFELRRVEIALLEAEIVAISLVSRRNDLMNVGGRGSSGGAVP